MKSEMMRKKETRDDEGKSKDIMKIGGSEVKKVLDVRELKKSEEN